MNEERDARKKGDLGGWLGHGERPRQEGPTRAVAAAAAAMGRAGRRTRGSARQRWLGRLQPASCHRVAGGCRLVRGVREAGLRGG